MQSEYTHFPFKLLYYTEKNFGYLLLYILPISGVVLCFYNLFVCKDRINDIPYERFSPHVSHLS